MCTYSRPWAVCSVVLRLRFHPNSTFFGVRHVGLSLYQSLMGTLFVVCETVTSLRRCGGTYGSPSNYNIYIMWPPISHDWGHHVAGRQCPSVTLHESTHLSLLRGGWHSGDRGSCLRKPGCAQTTWSIDHAPRPPGSSIKAQSFSGGQEPQKTDTRHGKDGCLLDELYTLTHTKKLVLSKTASATLTEQTTI